MMAEHNHIFYAMPVCHIVSATTVGGCAHCGGGIAVIFPDENSIAVIPGLLTVYLGTVMET